MGEKSNIRLTLEYDGTNYHGWQRQKNDRTIQALIEDSIRVMTGETLSLVGSGRTDAGVHALGQVCNFITGSGINPESMRRGLNSLLPGDIFVRHGEYVSLDFHSRYGAKAKSYEYRIWNKKEPNIFIRNYTWHVRELLDLLDMKKCLSMLVGRHDFSSFKSTGSGNMNPVREILYADLSISDEGMLCFTFEADGFLRHMVRNIVGTVIAVGKGRVNPVEFEGIFQSKDRRNAGVKAPPQGLFLKRVKY